MKKIEVVFYPDAEEVHQKLINSTSKKDKMLLKAIDHKVELIKQDIFYGNPIAKILIPAEYKSKYEVKSLFRVELPLFWRMLYSVTEDKNEIEIIAFVLDIVDHKKYNEKFKYK